MTDSIKKKCGIYIHGSYGEFTDEKAEEMESIYGIPFFGITYPWTDIDTSEKMLRSQTNPIVSMEAALISHQDLGVSKDLVF